MKILGIDPGYERIGIAVTEKLPGERTERLLFSDCFKTSSKIPFTERLKQIGEELERIILTHQPEAMGIESLFFNNNQKTAINVAEARGVLLYEAARKNVKIFEFSPLQIKLAVAGYGRADKKQVTDMVHKLVKVEKAIEHDDEYDAIAVALTCRACYRA